MAPEISESYDFDNLISLIEELKEEEAAAMSRAKATFKGNTAFKLVETSSADYQLQGIDENGVPIIYEAQASPTSTITRADALHDNGVLGLDLDGASMTVGIWDAGWTKTNHIEFEDRILLGDMTGEDNSHATSVSGALLAAGRI